MLSANFVRWSGLASALGSVLMVSSIVVSSAISDKEYPYDEGIADVLARLVFYFSMALLLVGLLGHNARRPAGMGFVGRTGIVVAAIGVIMVLASPIGYLLETLGWYGKDDELTWSMMMLGLIVMVIGMTVYAAAGLLNGALPRWAAAITTIGGAGVIAVIPITIFGLDMVNGLPESIVGASSIGFGVLFAIGWAWIGFTLWSSQPKAAQPSPAST